MLVIMIVSIVVSAIFSSLTTYVILKSLIKQIPQEIFNFKEIFKKNQIMNREEDIFNLLLKNFNKEKKLQKINKNVE